MGYLVLTQSQFWALPPTARRLLQCYGTERPQGWGKPTVIEIDEARIRQIEQAIREEQSKNRCKDCGRELSYGGCDYCEDVFEDD